MRDGRAIRASLSPASDALPERDPAALCILPVLLWGLNPLAMDIRIKFWLVQTAEIAFFRPATASGSPLGCTEDFRRIQQRAACSKDRPLSLKGERPAANGSAFRQTDRPLHFHPRVTGRSVVIYLLGRGFEQSPSARRFHLARAGRRNSRLSLKTRPSLGALRLHPRQSDLYRKKITNLSQALQKSGLRLEETQIMRSLTIKIRMVPDVSAPGGHEIELIGDLAKDSGIV